MGTRRGIERESREARNRDNKTTDGTQCIDHSLWYTWATSSAWPRCCT